MKGLQRFISGILAVCLLVSMLPVGVWATETEPVVETVPETMVWETQETIVIETSETIGTETTEITSETTEASSKNIEAVETSPEITAENVDSPATAAAITASGVWGDNLTWTLNNTGTLTISGTGPMDECWPESSPGWWDFPDQITSLIISEGVTTIGIQAFLNCPYLSSTHIPESVLEIGQHAFANDANLKEIILPAHLSVIGVSAFNHCGLTSVTIPSEVSSIGYGAFYGCRELTQISFTGDAPTIGDMAFYEVTATIYYPENNNTWTASVMQDYDGNITWVPYIPDASDGTVIGSGSCGNSLTWTLDDAGVLTISGNGAMYDYYPGDDEHWLSDHVSPELVTSVVFDGNITHLGAYAFSGTSIVDLTIPASITSMDVTALYGIDTLSGIWIENGNPNFTNDAYGVLYDINKTALIKMPNCFDGDYTIPSGVTFIYGESFCSCPNLTKVTIPDGVETIENSTFSGCSGLHEIIIPASVTSIGFAAFNDCASLETVYYTGTEEEWAAIDIYDAENDALYDAQIYCNYSPVDLTGWRKAYYENIEAYRSAHEDWGNWNESVTYEPIYIDDDTIPELWITYNNYYGGSEGFDFLRYRNDSVTNYDSFGIGSIDYIERGGVYRKSYSVNANFFETIYSIKNGTEVTLGSCSSSRINGVIEEEYTWGDVTVSQAKYQEKVNELLPQDQVKHTGSDNSKIFDYDGILEWLLNPETYYLVCTPEEPVVQTGQKLEIVVSLYCNDQLVKDWEPMGYSTGNLKYKNGRKADDGYHIILEADKVGDAHVTVNYTDDISITIPVTVVSDMEEDDFLRKDWIQEHIDYVASEEYAKEITAGYHGRMNPVFKDVIEDEGIQFYDFTDCVANLGASPSQADLYGIILADILMNSLNEDFMYEAYTNNLNTAMVDFAVAVSKGVVSIAGTTDIPQDVVKAIQNAAEVLKKTNPDTTAFAEARDDFLSIAKKNLDSDDFVKSANKGGFLTVTGIIFDWIDITSSTHEEIYIYACNSKAYQATSDDFMRVLESMEQKIYREFAPGDFPGLGKYDDAMNWSDLASAISGFRNEIEKNKLDRTKAVADFALKTEREASKLFKKNSYIAIAKYVGITILNCIPGLNAITTAYAILEAGKLAIEIFITADDRAYCLDMLTKLYCLSVLLDSTADDFAARMTEDKFWISAAFDEAVTMYKAIQKLAAEYMILYTDHMISKTYRDLVLAIATSNPVTIALNLAKFEETIAWYDNSKLRLAEQKTEIENILCHSPFLHYNSVTNEIQSTYLDSNIFIIACPTAVQVLDENEKQIAYLSNDTCQVENGHELYYRTIPLSDTESMKIAVVPDSYKMVVTGTAEGEMDVFAAEFKENIDTVNTYLDVPINIDSEIILESDKDDPEVIHLTVDDTPYEPFTANTIAQGTCGETLSWALYEEGILSITGSGEMYDFKMGESPWTEYRKQITVILLPDGLTRIGNEAFRGLYKVQSVTIPESVTEIGSCAFIMTGLTSVSLPESLRIIDSGAFSDTPLKAVDIPDSVTHIGNGAFSECDYVDHIFIPASVTTIGSGPFSNCRNLTSISVDPGNPNFITDANGVLYSSDMAKLYQCPGAYSGEYVIPYGVTTLDSCAFEGCAGLTKVTIPDSVTSLPGQSTFAYCTSLTELILPDRITELNYAFAFRVSSLTNIRLPKQLTVLDDAAFYDCSSLARIIIPELVTEIGSGCFKNTALRSVIFRGSAPSINETAFTGITATAYYPGNDPSWTADTMLDYGGSLTWVPVYENETVTHIDAKKTVLNAGETLDLTAVLDPGVLVDEEIIWTLYDNGDGGGTELITENGTTAKLYAGFYLYDNVITVTAQAANDSAEPAVLEITIRQREADYTLFAGKSVTLKETDPATGKPYASKRLQWYMSTENEPYATLTSAGKLTAKKVVSKNRIIVYADIDGKPGFMRVVDIYPAVTQVDVMWEDNNPINGKTIPVDFTTQNLLFTVTAHPLDTMQNVTWSISDSEKQTYAEYETNGRVLRVFNLKRTKAGTVTVKATVDAGQKKSTTFKLQFGSFAKEVKITAASNSLQSGNSLQLSAVTVPAKPTKSGITWSLSQEDKAYASISSSGLLKAKTVYGRTEITVIATSKDGQAQAEFPVTILPANSAVLLLKCGGKNVTKDTVYVDLNGDPTITLTAERFDRLAQPSVTWSVPKSAEVLEKTDTTLTLRFLKAGTATITATGADKQKATVKVVAAQMAQSVEISQKKTNLTEGFEVASGKTLELKATVENAKNKKVTWSLAPGDEAYAKISSSGKLTAAKNLTTMRQVTVTATAADGSGIYDEAVVSIRPIAQGVQIYSVVDGVRTFSVRSDPSRWVRSNTVYEWDMVANTRLTLSSHVYPYYAENHPRNAMQGVTWKSSSPKVASVDANGNVICHKPGSTTITATAKDGSSKKVTFKLTVVKKTTGLQLPDQQVIGGKTLALNKLVQYSPTDVTSKTLKWEIIGGTGTDYATLSSKGSLKTKKVTKPVTVTVRITATDGTHCTDTCTVTILPKS